MLVLFQTGQAIYLSVAATTLTAEIILQFLLAYMMGHVAHFARQQGFYVPGFSDMILSARDTDVTEREGQPGRDAILMYAGALLWLVVVAFTLAVVIKAILDVNVAIGNFRWVPQKFRGPRRTRISKGG